MPKSTARKVADNEEKNATAIREITLQNDKDNATQVTAHDYIEENTTSIVKDSIENAPNNSAEYEIPKIIHENDQDTSAEVDKVQKPYPICIGKWLAGAHPDLRGELVCPVETMTLPDAS